MKTIITDEMKYKISKTIILNLLQQQLITVDEFNKVLYALAKIYNVTDHNTQSNTIDA